MVGERPLNKAAFAIHAAIHEHDPKIIAAAHTHSTYGKAWSTLGRKLDTLTQDACVFHEDHALFDDFTRHGGRRERRTRIARALGERKGAILKNHGILSAGPSVEAAAWWYIALDNACHTQLLAEAAGTPQPIDEAVARHTHSRSADPRARCMPSRASTKGWSRPNPNCLTEPAESTMNNTSFSRRRVLRAGGAAAVVASSGLIATRAWSQQRKLSFAWNASAFCLSPVVVAQERGIFEKNGLQVELINYTGSTDQLLESLATAKADAAVGMIHRWLSRSNRASTSRSSAVRTAAACGWWA